MLLKYITVACTLCFLSVFPAYAAEECVYKGSKEDLLNRLNKMDEVSDVDKNNQDKDYVDCLIKVREDSLRKDPYAKPPLTETEEKIVKAYYAIYDRDSKYRNAIGFDSSLG